MLAYLSQFSFHSWLRSLPSLLYTPLPLFLRLSQIPMAREGRISRRPFPPFTPQVLTLDLSSSCRRGQTPAKDSFRASSKPTQQRKRIRKLAIRYEGSLWDFKSYFVDPGQIATLKNRLSLRGYTPDEPQINYAINSKHANGDLEKAFELLILFQESVDGIVKPYDPSVHMKGAENRDAVTCYLDSVLFAMFARLGSFEPILYTRFDDEPRRRLSTLIRLWVNMLRMGMLIQTDIVCAPEKTNSHR